MEDVQGHGHTYRNKDFISHRFPKAFYKVV